MTEQGPTQDSHLLVIRLGALGDIIHALPAVASLKLSFADRKLAWLISSKWTAILAGNPYVDKLITFDRRGVGQLRDTRRDLRKLNRPLAVDFQGLVQSALLGRMSRPERFYGFDRDVAREPLATYLYSDRIAVKGPHRVQRNLQLITAMGATRLTEKSWIPPGSPEGGLPKGHFVLASPFAGWASKQWPLANYDELGRRLRNDGLPLVLNVPTDRVDELKSFRNVLVHSSGLNGLIDATRRATGVIGVDSGPLHLAAALGKPGVALYGPTDPAQTGPFNCPMTVLRKRHAFTSYKRKNKPDPLLTAILPREVLHALHASLANPAGSSPLAVNAE